MKENLSVYKALDTSLITTIITSTIIFTQIREHHTSHHIFSPFPSNPITQSTLKYEVYQSFHQGDGNVFALQPSQCRPSHQTSSRRMGDCRRAHQALWYGA
jgi:hypothetical protein